MKDNWHSKTFAKKWDDTSDVGNPTRRQQLKLISLLVQNLYTPGTTLLDMGFGSGQVEENLFKSIPDLKFIGIDSSDAMIELAKNRLADFQFEVIKHELTDINNLKLPVANISVALSVQALHELTHEQKQSVFKYVHNVLIDDGYYIILDRFTIPTKLGQAFEPVWNYLEDSSYIKSGKTFRQYNESLLSKEDYTATVEQHILWLNEAGFEASVVFLAMNRGIIVARK